MESFSHQKPRWILFSRDNNIMSANKQINIQVLLSYDKSSKSLREMVVKIILSGKIFNQPLTHKQIQLIQPSITTYNSVESMTDI